MMEDPRDAEMDEHEERIELARSVRALTEEIRAGREMAAEDLRQQHGEVLGSERAAEHQRKTHAEELAKLKAAHEAEVTKFRKEVAALSSKFEVEELLQRAIRLGEQEGFYPHSLSIRAASLVELPSWSGFEASQQGAFGSAEGKALTVLGALHDLFAKAEEAGKKRREAIDAQFPAGKK